MDVKQYLRQVKVLDEKISQTEEHIQELKNKAEGLSAIRYDKDKVQQTSPSDMLSETMARIDELERKYVSTVKKYVDTRDDVYNLIMSMTDQRYIKILCMRYLRFESLENIAVSMHYTYRYINVLHGEALEELRKTWRK